MNPERRFDRGSWAALLFALFILFMIFFQSVSIWRVPGDGWVLNDDSRADPPQAFFDLNLNTEPTPIQHGDVLLTVEGQGLKEIETRQFRFFEVRAPDWSDGTVLHYTVRRDGKEVAIDVRQRLFSPWQLTLAYWRLMPGPALVQFLATPFFFLVGLVVFFLRPRNRAAHALLLIGVSFLFQIVPLYFWASTMFYPFPPASIPVDGWTLAINPSIMYLALAFPAPKLPIRRFPRLTIAALYLSAPLALNSAYLLNLNNPAGYYGTATIVYISQILLVFVVTFGSLIHSALTLREPVARAQLKWVGLGLASFIVPGIGGWLLGYLASSSEWVYLLSVVGWFLFPVCLAIAITRYRLFDIDVIIRRTLLYSALTGILVALYYSSVILIQQVARVLTGQAGQSQLAIVVSTLGIAALFSPLRRRIQEFIDWRFYRQRYDAEKTLAGFGDLLRSEVDLDQISAGLVSVVDATLKPGIIVLRLKPFDRKRQPHKDSSQPIVIEAGHGSNL
jgi:hypothetical protein